MAMGGVLMNKNIWQIVTCLVSLVTLSLTMYLAMFVYQLQRGLEEFGKAFESIGSAAPEVTQTSDPIADLLTAPTGETPPTWETETPPDLWDEGTPPNALFRTCLTQASTGSSTLSCYVQYPPDGFATTPLRTCMDENSTAQCYVGESRDECLQITDEPNIGRDAYCSRVWVR